MNTVKNLDEFNTMPVGKAVWKNALPAMASMVMVLVYNLADTFFIGQTHDAVLVAAVSLATPVYLIFMSAGTVFGIGGTSVISRSMGAGRKDYARKVCSFCMWSCVVVGVALALLLWFFLDEILVWIGSSAETLRPARTYLAIVLTSAPFILIGNCFSNVLRAEGQSTSAMMGMLVGNLLNVILDPLMIITFGWGIAGAAIATVIGNVVGAGYYLGYFLKGKSTLSISVKDFTIKEHTLSDVLSIGIPASLGSLLMSVSSIILNSRMASYGDMALAGIGVAAKVTMMTGMLCIGLGQGVQPLLGYCVGAKSWTRYKSVLHQSLSYAFFLGTMLTIVCYVFSKQIVRAFLSNGEAFTYGLGFTRIYLSTSFLFGLYYVLLNALQAMGAAKASLIVNLSRQGLVFIPLMFLFQAMIGINGLVWAQPVADLISTMLVALLYVRAEKKLMADVLS